VPPVADKFASVPPFASRNRPLTPLVKGNPVVFVSTPEAGVPSAGVTRVGDVASTTSPDPVVPLERSLALGCDIGDFAADDTLEGFDEGLRAMAVAPRLR
jgi:hypothetical protein